MYFTLDSDEKYPRIILYFDIFWHCAAGAHFASRYFNQNCFVLLASFSDSELTWNGFGFGLRVQKFSILFSKCLVPCSSKIKHMFGDPSSRNQVTRASKFGSNTPFLLCQKTSQHLLSWERFWKFWPILLCFYWDHLVRKCLLLTNLEKIDVCWSCVPWTGAAGCRTNVIVRRPGMFNLRSVL